MPAPSSTLAVPEILAGRRPHVDPLARFQPKCALTTRPKRSVRSTLQAPETFRNAVANGGDRTVARYAKHRAPRFFPRVDDSSDVNPVVRCDHRVGSERLHSPTRLVRG